ncbi:MAG: sorting and assembly machinery component 50 [Prosthecochloris sp.]|nr:sorting and assembly machinery component 50 [Prosthecochloris sp.]
MLAVLCSQRASDAAQPATKSATAAGFVTTISISGNRAITTEELRSVMSTRENTRYFGFFKPWVGIHRFAEHLFNDSRGAYSNHKTLLSGSSSVKTWMQNSIGEAPVEYVDQEFRRDISLIKKLYAYKGYFYARIDTVIDRDPETGRTSLDIIIEENTPARIDTLHYRGIDQLETSVRERYLSTGVLHLDDIFSVDNLIRERDRSVDFFKEYGYGLMHEDSIRIQVDTVGVLAGVRVDINLPERLRYGSLRAVVHDPRTPDSIATVTRTIRDSIDITHYGEQHISDNLVSSFTAYRPGELTRQSLQQKTLQNFGATNVFSSVFIRNDSVSNGRLHTSIHLEPKPRHLIEPSVFADNRYGSLFAGTSISYENKNLFGSAENLSISTDFGMQLGTSNNLLDSLDEEDYDPYRAYELGISASLVMPELSNPGNVWETSLEYSRSRLPILLDNQKALARISYNTSLSPYSRLNVDFFELEWVKKDSLRGFGKLFTSDLAENIGIDPDDPTEISDGLDSLLQTSINQTLRLQYYFSNRNEPAKTTTSKFNITAEAVGGLAWLIDEYVDTGSYGGFTDSDPQIFGTTYSQFLKLSTQYSFFTRLSENEELAGRLFAGWMAPYGKAESTPDERRFYAGGPNSMRGWLFNTLGPGNNDNEASATLGADIKLEGNLEYRVQFFKVFGQPSGIALFTDIGNIWDRTGTYGLTLNSLYQDIAWDMGIGLRIGSPIGPFRFDFAYKLYDPSEKPDPWQLSEWKPGDYTFNFGIGEPF